jgi:mRNA interferase RelE/StbE
MVQPRCEVEWTETAARMLEEIPDRRVQRPLYSRASELADKPEKQGKPLTGELTGFRSVRAVGQRFRIIYRVQRGDVVVVIAAARRRKHGSTSDIYELAKKLIRQRLVPSGAIRATRKK